MDKDKHIFLEHKDCIPKDVLIRYVNDQLDARERHRVEKHAIDCAMCSDAIEGLMEMKDRSQLKGIIDNLDRRVTAKEQSGPKILWMDTRVRVAAAAGAALLIGLVYFFNRNLNSVTNEKTVSENLSGKTNSVASDTAVRPDSVKNALEQKGKDEVKRDDQVSPTNSSNALPVPDDRNEKNNAGAGGKEAPKQTQQDGPTFSLTKSKKTNEPTGDDRSNSGEKEKLKDIPKKQDEVKKEPDKNDKYYTGNTLDNNTSKTEKPGNDKTVDDSEGTREEKQDVVLSDKTKEKDLKKHTEDDQKAPTQTNSNGGNFGFSSNNNQSTSPQPKSISENNDADGKSVSDTTKTVSMLDSVSYRKDVENGVSDYNAKNYKSAEVSFKETLRSNPVDRKALFYLGSTYLDQGKPDLAIEQFDKVIALGKGEYYDDARYKKADALIQQNKKTEAKKILDGLIKEGGPMKPKALDLEKK